MGRSHFSFGGERKVCKRKPAARRLREKALYCPFLKEGVRNVARITVRLPTFTFVRARAHSFPLSKRARLFPSAAYRRSAPPQSAWGILTPCRVSYFLPVDRFARQTNEGLHFPAVGVGHTYPLQIENFFAAWPILENDRPAGLEKRAARPSAERRYSLANWQGAAPDPRAAVKPRPSRMSHEQPRALWARCGVKGYYPLGKEFWKNEYAKCC